MPVPAHHVNTAEFASSPISVVDTAADVVANTLAKTAVSNRIVVMFNVSRSIPLTN